jgi:hypothetical protein
MKGQKWSGLCTWCGTRGDASSLFGYSACAGQNFFCSARQTDCLDQWLAANGRSPWCAPHETPCGRQHKPKAHAA